MLTCLCDAFFGEVGIATARVLEAAGFEVEFPEEQTCCGQPPFNAGDWEASKKVAHHTLSVFGRRTVVVPSGSCTAMMRHGNEMLAIEKTPDVFELAEFLAAQGIVTWPPNPDRTVRTRQYAFHCACHGRAIGLGSTAEDLVATIPGVTLSPFEQEDQCCGFGGAFSSTHGHLSSSIGMEKLRCMLESGAEEIISGDMGCLMHLNGLILRHELPLRTRHYAEVLAEALDG